MKKAALTLSLLIPLTLFSQIDSLRAHFATGTAAYEQQDYSGFLASMLKANRFRAYYPPVIYNVAAGYALTDQPQKSVEWLKVFISMNSQVAIDDDPDFEKLRATPEYLELKQLQQKLSETMLSSGNAFTINGTTHVESITQDPKSGKIYLGDVRDRTVYSFQKSLKELFHTDHPNFYSVMGLDLDTKNQILWICTAALPQMSGYTDSLEGYSSLFSYDLKKQKLTHRATLAGGAAFGDVIVVDGTVFISDGLGNRLYHYRQSDGLKVFQDLSGLVRNLQGLTRSIDGTSLYVSDYISGIYRISLIDGALKKVMVPAGTPFKGIDGLYSYKNTLIGIQNGSKPLRVVQFELNTEGDEITDFQLLDQNVEFLNEPTQGVFNQNEFIFISDSPWGLYDEDNNFLDRSKRELHLRKMRFSE